MIALLRLLIAKDLGLVSGRNRGLSRENMPSQDAGRPLIAAVHSRSPRCPKCGAMMSLRIIEPERQSRRVKTGKAQCEHMVSALPLRADIAQQTRHVRFVPQAEVIGVIRSLRPHGREGTP